ncbi:MAG: hypothetical protein ACKOYC_06715 [Bacteroidota bacterium]
MYIVKNEDANYKSQIITFDALARITGSCDTLFEVSQFKQADYDRLKPYLIKVINYLNSPVNTGAPLFFPKIAFECGTYKSRCDFTFVRSTDIYGNVTITCLIADNPTQRYSSSRKKRKKDQDSERISA